MIVGVTSIQLLAQERKQIYERAKVVCKAYAKEEEKAVASYIEGVLRIKKRTEEQMAARALSTP